MNILTKPNDAPIGSIWRHHNDGLYLVVGHSNFEGSDDPERRKKYPPTIEYLGMNGKRWSGRADDWERRMKRERQLEADKERPLYVHLRTYTRKLAEVCYLIGSVG